MIKSSLVWTNQAKLESHLNHSFFVKLSDWELGEFGEMVDVSDTCTQIITSQLTQIAKSTG